MRLVKAPWFAVIATLALIVGCQASQPEMSLDQLSKKEAPSESVEGGGFGGESDTSQVAPGAPAARNAAPSKDMGATSQNEVRDEKAAADKPKAAEAKKDASAGLYIIRRANLTLQVDEVKAGVKRTTEIARAVGGFVAESAFEAAEGAVPSARMVLRVPAEKFDTVLDSLGGVGKVFRRNIESDDVTLEFVDTTSRIKNLRQEESTLLKLLQRSGKLSEVLEMERELSRVRGEIEQSQGRLRHLGSLVSLATIEVSLSEKVQVVSTSPWGQIPAAFENAWNDVERALAGAIEWVLRTGVWAIGYFLPLALPLIALYLIGGWALRGWLIERRKFMPDAWFTRFWVGLGLALLAMVWPPLAGLIVMAALAAAVIGAGSLVVSKFFVRKREID